MNLLLDVVVPQLAKPHGALGRLFASLLDRGNQAINLHVVGALDLSPNERVLEVGFGGGVGLALALAHEPRLALSGLDLSADMVARCRKRFGDKVLLAQGSVEALPFGDAAFDKLFGANITYFWPDFARAAGELRRVLAPGGLLAFGIRPPETLLKFKFDAAGHRVWSAEQYVEAFGAAGFRQVKARRVPDPAGAYVLTACKS
ncbi:MAG TPA: class I SAM-dependent methyltransferase [Polyangiales bacterium]